VCVRAVSAAFVQYSVTVFGDFVIVSIQGEKPVFDVLVFSVHSCTVLFIRAFIRKVNYICDDFVNIRAAEFER